MTDQTETLHVISGPSRFYPHAFRWQGRTVRVLAVESIKTLGMERRYRVRTGQGYFELSLCTDADAWRLRRSPGVLSRLWARWRNAPRFPLPFWRLRARRTVVRPVVRPQFQTVAPARLVQPAGV
jgi:hypothetical protein